MYIISLHPTPHTLTQQRHISSNVATLCKLSRAIAEWKYVAIVRLWLCTIYSRDNQMFSNLIVIICIPVCHDYLLFHIR